MSQDRNVDPDQEMVHNVSASRIANNIALLEIVQRATGEILTPEEMAEATPHLEAVINLLRKKVDEV